MALKLLTLFVLVAACGIVHARKAGAIASRQGNGGSFFSEIARYPEQVMNGVSSGFGGLPFGGLNPINDFLGISSDSGTGSSGSGSESSGGSSGSSSGGFNPAQIFGMPGQMLSSIFGTGSGSSQGFPFNIFRFPFGGSSGQQSSGGTGSTSSGAQSSSGGSGTSGIPSSSALENAIDNFGGGQSSSGIGSFPGISGAGQNLGTYCRQACNIALPFSRSGRLVSSERKGASHGRKERRGKHAALQRSTARQHTRQSQSSSSSFCPEICDQYFEYLEQMFPNFGSSSTGTAGASSDGSGSSASGSQDSGASSGGSSGSQSTSGGSSSDSDE